jgi:DNA topoisomerase II
METEMTEAQQNETKGRKGPSKRGATKKAPSSLAVISSDDDNDFAMKEASEMETQKKGRGRKPTAADKLKATTTRKRAPAQGKAMKQKVLDEMLKPIEESNTSAPSPEKKVRKMRNSPFHKKSGSVLQRGAAAASTTTESIAETSPTSGSSIEPVAAPQPRRTARTTRKATVVYDESDDDEDEVSDDSDFDLNDKSDDE